MALPSTVAEILEAAKDALEAITWPAAIDSDEPVVFKEVIHTAAFPFGSPYDQSPEFTPEAALALVVYRGSTVEREDMPQFITTTVGIGIVTHYPNDRNGQLALMGAKGLHGIVTEVRKAMHFLPVLADALWWSNTSMPAVLVESEDEAPGRSFVALEVTFKVEHQDVVPV